MCFPLKYLTIPGRPICPLQCTFNETITRINLSPTLSDKRVRPLTLIYPEQAWSEGWGAIVTSVISGDSSPPSHSQREEDYYVVTVTRGVEGLHNTEMSVTIIQRHFPPELRGHHQAQISGGGGGRLECLPGHIYLFHKGD